MTNWWCGRNREENVSLPVHSVSAPSEGTSTQKSYSRSFLRNDQLMMWEEQKRSLTVNSVNTSWHREINTHSQSLVPKIESDERTLHCRWAGFHEAVCGNPAWRENWFWSRARQTKQISTLYTYSCKLSILNTAFDRSWVMLWVLSSTTLLPGFRRHESRCPFTFTIIKSRLD